MFCKTIKISFFFLLLTAFYFSLPAESIKAQSGIENTFDSLLISGDFEEANDLLNKSDLQLLSDTKENYFKILSEIKKIDTISLDSGYIKELFEQYKNNRENFKTENAGEKSSIAYSNFLELSDIDTKKAIKYYIIADFLKKKYIQSQILKVEAKIKKAEKFYGDNKITEALNILDSIKLIIPEGNIKFKALNDELDLLREKVNKGKHKQEIHKSLWEQEEKVDYTFKLGVGGTIGSIYPLQHEILGLDPGFAINKYGFSIFLNISPYKRLSLGLDLTLTYNSYSSISSGGTSYLFSFNAYSRSIQAYIEFLLRDKAGLRPNINLGLGYLHVSSEAFTAYLIVSQGTQTETRPYPYPKMTFNTLQILTEIGTEFISSTTTKFIVGSKLSFYYNTRDIKALDQFNISLSLNVGTFF